LKNPKIAIISTTFRPIARKFDMVAQFDNLDASDR